MVKVAIEHIDELVEYMPGAVVPYRSPSFFRYSALTPIYASAEDEINDICTPAYARYDQVASRRPEGDHQIITVEDYAKLWMINKVNRKRKRFTLARYEGALANHILPEIGHIYLSKLTRMHVESWVAGAQSAWIEDEDGEPVEIYSIDTVRGWWRVMKPMLMDAWAEGLSTDDVTRRVSDEGF